MGCNQSVDSVAVTKPSSRPNVDSMGVESQDEGGLTPNSTSNHQHSTGTETRDLLPGATDSESRSPNSEVAKGRRRNRRRPSQESNRNNYLLSLEDDNNHNNSGDDGSDSEIIHVPEFIGEPSPVGNDDRDRPPTISATSPLAPMPMCVIVETMSIPSTQDETHDSRSTLSSHSEEAGGGPHHQCPPTSVIMPSNRKKATEGSSPQPSASPISSNRPSAQVDSNPLGINSSTASSSWVESQSGVSMAEPERAEWWKDHIGHLEAQDFPYDKEEIAAQSQPPGKKLVKRIQDWTSSN